jgi:NAD(P)-dependent dehydrogenase (short-subunit alcohol dehydrogenase family)
MPAGGLSSRMKKGLKTMTQMPNTEQRDPQITHEPTPPAPKQKLDKPGIEAEMEQRPRWRAPKYRAAGKLEGKVALVTGGDSGIGRAVAYLYAREGADVAIVHLPEEQQDAEETRRAIEEEGRRCLTLAGDLSQPKFCQQVVERTVQELGQLDILVSNAAHQNHKKDVSEISEEEWQRTLDTNIGGYFHLTKAAVPHMKAGSAIIATSSETGLMGQKELLDYSATKGAINAFTKALAQNLISRGIRVNAVAPGPVWTPLNPADRGTSPEQIEKFGSKAPIGRAAQPEELAPAYVFLASDADSSYVSGIVLEEMGALTTAG